MVVLNCMSVAVSTLRISRAPTGIVASLVSGFNTEARVNTAFDMFFHHVSAITGTSREMCICQDGVFKHAKSRNETKRTILTF